MKLPIPVIDIFAGPGGLGEGFSAARSPSGSPFFEVVLSIEKEQTAHKTVELRAFYRQYARARVPSDYYRYLRGEITREELASRHSAAFSRASEQAWWAELGREPNRRVDLKIRQALGGASDWVLIGGPPCQAYSLAGRSRMMYSNPTKFKKDSRHFLYKEYLRILGEHRPPVFVMENVKGLLSAKIGNSNTLGLILKDLKEPTLSNGTGGRGSVTYDLFGLSGRREQELFGDPVPESFVVHSEDYGIPQARHRLIIVGIRSDLKSGPPGSLQKAMAPSVMDVIGDLPRLRSGLSKEEDSADGWEQAITSMMVSERLRAIPSDVSAGMRRAVARLGKHLPRGGRFTACIVGPKKYRDWYMDEELGGVCNHETRRHLKADLQRYFFAAAYASVREKSPVLSEFPTALLPKHQNVAEALRGSKFNDRFRVQLAGKPATTVVSHISKDGHYYIHYDACQGRSLTVREAARLQTFPDNYFFEGTRTEQYQQVGNAVPPLLASGIARLVAGVFGRLQK